VSKPPKRSFAQIFWAIYLVYTLTMLTGGCSISSSSSASSTSILFTTCGTYPFGDSVYLIGPDGSNLRQLLAPRRGRSYLHASSNELQQGLTLLVHETNSAGIVEDHVYLHRLGNNEWRRLITVEGLEGANYLSPDNSRVAFVFAPKSEPDQLRPWVVDLKTGAIQKLTPDDNESGVWDGYFSWRPDGKDIVFVRLRTDNARVSATLMRASLSGGKLEVLLGPDVGVAAACYAPNGERLAILAQKGLEILDIAREARTVILPWDRMPQRHFRVGGLAWSGILDKIALSLFNNQTKEYEIWTISSNGADAQRIYSHNQDKGRITVAGFVQK
jgi:dipeptidyl aminopeptidase/acylaminoacyl peptidase